MWPDGRVYPRVCGGTEDTARTRHHVVGLSPRVRGNHRPQSPPSPAMRSIPACAGEPCWSRPGWCSRPVYPRVCGGTRLMRYSSNPDKGLSPRVRGNHFPDAQPAPRVGSIPACAGEPAWCTLTFSRATVYPRVCGGTVHHVATGRAGTGLSPRVRGNRFVPSLTPLRKGSIPACAGEPPRYERSTPRAWVYPRVCGGTIQPTAAAKYMSGLSPRVRGNPYPRRYRTGIRGSIPACAGEPIVI